METLTPSLQVNVPRMPSTLQRHLLSSASFTVRYKAPTPTADHPHWLPMKIPSTSAIFSQLIVTNKFVAHSCAQVERPSVKMEAQPATARDCVYKYLWRRWPPSERDGYGEPIGTRLESRRRREPPLTQGRLEGTSSNATQERDMSRNEYSNTVDAPRGRPTARGRLARRAARLLHGLYS